jgi:hypothetical protein
MASDPDSDRDSNISNTSSPNSENPFIKFRQFADAQIGSLLQGKFPSRNVPSVTPNLWSKINIRVGIIGLPSAFSKNSPGNTRWADFDDDLRRRDELQARQRQLKDSEAQRWTQRTPREESEIPVKKWTWHSDNERAPTQIDEQMARDLPLYSPVHKSLFAHLDQRGDNAPDWNPTNFVNSVRKGLVPEYWPMKLHREQQSPDVMKSIQYLVYNDLNCEPQFSSDYSLLPYILFSPYSPLKLSANRVLDPSLVQTFKTGYPGGDPGTDKFPYCEAFQDLITTVHGDPDQRPWGNNYDNLPLNGKAGFPFDTYPPSVKAIFGKSWIDDLWASGLLQQKETKSISHLVEWPGPWASPSLVEYGKYLRDTEAAAQTEQDMYDRFLSAPARIVSEPARIPETIALLFDDAESFIQKRLQEPEKSPEGKAAVRSMLDSRLAKDIFRMIQKTEGMAEPPQLDENPESATPDIPPKPTPDTSKVVATSTTSERNVDEDGSVETTVTVWKRFADGRESTTTTTHFEDAAGWKESEEGSQESKPEKKPEKKRGWFWN